jgi:Fur family zinc uptake transcriptional regulator
VLDVLRQAQKPMSAYGILNGLEGSSIRAAAQVYRSLEKLVRANRVHKIASLNAFIACAHPEHDFLPGFYVCKLCGSVTECNLSQTAEPLRRGLDSGFKVDAINIEIQGVCQACQMNGETRA